MKASARGIAETFSYGIPGATLEGRRLLHYGAWKAHVSLYAISAAARRRHASALKGYKTSRGTVQFPLDRRLPAALIARLVRDRVAEVRAAQRA